MDEDGTALTGVDREKKLIPVSLIVEFRHFWIEQYEISLSLVLTIKLGS